jgi:hypothetical protein
MNLGECFAWVMVALDIGAAIGYGHAGQWRMTVYWTAAAILTASVTWPR